MQQHVEDRTGGRKLIVRFVSCTACGYEFPRGGASCPRCGQPGPESPTSRIAKKRRNASKVMLGLLMMAAGGLSLFSIAFPMNLILGLTALILGAATARAWQCGHCGGHVDRDAVECPRCTLTLV